MSSLLCKKISDIRPFAFNCSSRPVTCDQTFLFYSQQGEREKKKKKKKKKKTRLIAGYKSSVLDMHQITSPPTP